MKKLNLEQVPAATRKIFSQLLARNVEFFEAGSIDGDSIFFSGKIDGRAFALTLAIDRPHELLK